MRFEGEVLLRDRCGAGRPSFAEVAQVGDQYVGECELQGHRSEQVVERVLSRRGVEPVERLLQSASQFRDQWTLIELVAKLVGRSQPCRLRGRQALSDERGGPSYSRLVCTGVEPEPADERLGRNSW